MRNAQKPAKEFSLLLLYLFSFLLLWEWLRPLEELTDTGHIGVFLGFVIVALVMSFFSVPLIVSAFVKSMLILYSVHFMYFEGPFVSRDWAGMFFEDAAANLGLLLDRQWNELSNVFRTVLFFILLWLMTYLIKYWLINRKQIFAFFFMTLIYITVLDTFSPYDADYAIVRTVIAGFTVLGILAYNRLADQGMVGRNYKKWMIPLLAMIALSAALGYTAPKAEPIWPDPVPFIKSFNEESGAGGVKKAGYGTDDSALGGPFTGDDRVVFTAEADRRHYWRVETKDVYTGKGWLAEPGTALPVTFLPEQDIPLEPFESAVKTEPLTSSVIPKIGYPHIVYPLGVSQVQAPESSENLEFSLDPATEKILSLANGEAGVIGPYDVTYESPVYNVEKLKASGADSLPLENYANSQFFAKYTQLPEEFPDRIKDLAAEVTQGKQTWLEKAEAIENYFQLNDFVYDQTLVAVPAEDQDYVDQFLFETQRGYCDNFSTSMVVMMRSIGIPARWVKGYTEGEYLDTLDGGRRIYEITNNNAHSWVEVYFPGVGWVPFEPTKGFSNNVQFEEEKKATPQTDEEKKAEENAAPLLPKKPELPEEKENASQQKVSLSGFMDRTGAFLAQNIKKIVLTLLVIAGFSAFLYKFRAKWMPSVYILLYKHKKENKYLEKAYLALLKQLERYGLKREQGQTLREYALYVDQFFSSKEMRRLTEKYEEYVYRGQSDHEMWENAKKHWEILIRKAGA